MKTSRWACLETWWHCRLRKSLTWTSAEQRERNRPWLISKSEGVIEFLSKDEDSAPRGAASQRVAQALLRRDAAVVAEGQHVRSAPVGPYALAWVSWLWAGTRAMGGVLE